MVHNFAYQTFIADAAKAQQVHPRLHLKQDGIPELSGTIVLKDSSGFEIDNYQVKIQASLGYPYYFPLVFETGGKIPINIDWHVYENDGHLCICTTTDEYIKTIKGMPLDLFITNELTPYLFNQTYRREKGFFLNEMDHGEKGQLQSLKNILNTNDINNIKWFLLMAKNSFKQNRTSDCFCLSGKKYRHCHRDILETFKQLDTNKINVLLNLVENSIEFKMAQLIK